MLLIPSMLKICSQFVNPPQWLNKSERRRPEFPWTMQDDVYVCEWRFRLSATNRRVEINLVAYEMHHILNLEW